jgi:uncharacterized membrane protein
MSFKLILVFFIVLVALRMFLLRRFGNPAQQKKAAIRLAQMAVILVILLIAEHLPARGMIMLAGLGALAVFVLHYIEP